MVTMMRAVVLTEPGPVSNLQIRTLPVPEPRPGWVRIKVGAFGLNRDPGRRSRGRPGPPDRDRGGVDAALELVGTPTLRDTLSATRIHGTVCFAGMLSNEWTVPNFYPIAYLPTGVRLTAYSGDTADLPTAVLQRSLDQIADGRMSLGPSRSYLLDDIRDAHAAMEANTGSGKIVVLTAPEAA